MLATLVYLYGNREKPPLFSNRWTIVWVKRSYHLFGLLRLSIQTSIYRAKGANIGYCADISPAKAQRSMNNLRVGSYSYVGSCFLMLHSEIAIGSSVVINDNVTILTGSHLVNAPLFGQVNKPVRIGDFAWICTGSIILPGCRIGEGAVVAAGAVVSKDVAPFSIVAGSPAKEVRIRSYSQQLRYKPNLLRACYEAWVGKTWDLSASNEF
jgi:acetyltransferase-like isoleucine patch superfamily enzyme